MAAAADALPSDRRGHGARLVLVHGFTQTRACWAPVDDDLATDHELVLVDAPGHGEAADLDPHPWPAADGLVAAGGQATYLGYSMGGRLCLHAALAHPTAVERLVLVSASPGLADPAERAARRASDEALAEHIGDIGVPRFVDEWLAQPLFAGLPSERAHRAARLANSAAGLAASLRCFGTGAQESLWPRLGELTMPVLLVAGDRDAKFVAIAEHMREAIGPTATVRLIEGAGHTAHLEHVDRFVRVLRDWWTDGT